MRVFKLLSAEFALDDIRHHRVMISLVGSLNDPYDLLGIGASDPELTSVLVRAKDQMAETKGLVCFSRDWSNPVLWSHYGSKHEGIALGFDIRNETAMAVEYLKRPIPEAAFVNAYRTGVNDHFEAIIHRLLTVKFRSWAYEEEVRIFADLNEKDGDGRYWSEFGPDTLQLREVVLGVRCPLNQEGVRAVLQESGFGPEISISCAKLSRIEFKMV